MAAARSTSRYQVLLVGLLSLNFGIVFFDRNALNFLMPFVQPELGLSSAQVGLTAAALSLTWAISGFVFGAASDRTGRRKRFLIIATVAFSVCSFISGLAASFSALLAARLLMGIAEGGVLPLSQSMTAAEVSPERRGVAMGVMQNFGSNLLGSFAAPVLLVMFATHFGWRNAFFLAGVPGLLSALLVWWFVRENPAPVRNPALESAPRASFREIFGHRNMVLCAGIAVLLVSYLVITWAFLPLFLINRRGIDPTTMGWLMGMLGVSATIGSFIVPGLSDRIGRKPIMIVVPLIAIALPLGGLFYGGPIWILGAIFFFGWALNGIFPMFMATIPSETVSAGQVATALGLVMGIGEVFGGVFGPIVAGLAADRFGLAAPLWILVGVALLASLLALGLVETAPAKRLRTLRRS